MGKPIWKMTREQVMQHSPEKIKVFRAKVWRALTTGKYEKMVSREEATPNMVKEIVNSAGFDFPHDKIAE